MPSRFALSAAFAACIAVSSANPGTAAADVQAQVDRLYRQDSRRIFATLTAGDPFHPDNVARLRLIGLMLADPLVAMIKVALERQSLRNAPNEG